MNATCASATSCLVEVGDIIPPDGEIVEGVASSTNLRLQANPRR